MARISQRTVARDADRIGSVATQLAVPKSLVAAGQRLRPDNGSGGVSGGGKTGAGSDWQADAWGFLDSVGELSYVCNWLSNALSRVTILASDLDPETGQPTGTCDDQEAVDTVRDIAGGPAGQAALFSRMATYFTVPGDMYVAIIFRDPPEGAEVEPDEDGETSVEEWYVLSTDEVKKSNGKIELSLPDGTKYEMNGEEDSVFRVYTPHPRRSNEATSPVRSAIPILREIVRLGQHVEATAKSRLTGNGILVLPQELSMPVANAPTGERTYSGVDGGDAPGLPAPVPPPSNVPQAATTYSTRSVNANDVMQAVVDAGSTAVEDPGSAAATVPIMLQAPGEFLDKIKHIKMGSEFTEVVMKLREAATKRLALSLDVPAEILLGVGDMNHWSAWQMEESAIKLHIEPIMVKICDALTEYVLRPMLRLTNHPDPSSVVIWYDTTGLAMRPNRSQDAKDAHAAGAISAQALMEYLGFTSDDALDLTDPDHLKAWLVSMVMKNPTLLSDPSIAEQLGIQPIAPPPASAPSQPSTEPDAEDTTPIPTEDDSDDTDELPAAASMLADMCVHRAMSLAGSRLRTRGNLSTVGLDTPKHLTHLRLPSVSEDRVPQLIRGWEDAIDGADPKVVAALNLTQFKSVVVSRATEALTHHRKPKPIRSLVSA